MSWLLIVHHDEEVRHQAGRVLARAIGPALPRMAFAANIAQARQCLAENGSAHCGLVVLGDATPADAASSVGLSGASLPRCCSPS